MLKSVFVAGLVLSSVPAAAIRWDFDDGTMQGWSAKEAAIWGGIRELHLLSGEVDEGVWRIAVDPAVVKSFYSDPGVELISSPIGYDSSLFDHVRIRFRTVHDRPTEGVVALEWTNEHNALFSGWDPAGDLVENRFGTRPQRVAYTTEWQEMVISLSEQDEKIWEGLLKDIQLIFALDNAADESGGTVMEYFEVDWIELTGVEELLQGELPPPPVAYFGWTGAGLFSAPVFYAIAPGMGRIELAFAGTQNGVLTDLDGDGDLDLFALWKTITMTEIQSGLESKSGWLMALNDGRGGLEQRRIEEAVATSGMSVELEMIGGDLTGDGKEEFALSVSDGEKQVIEIWSIDAELQVEVLVQIEDKWIVDVADWDGDGRVELFVGETWLEAGSTLEVWEVEQGVWVTEVVATAQTHVPYQIGDFIDDGTFNVLWTPIFGQANTWIVGALNEALHSDETFGLDAWKRPPLGVGDFDGDGQVDFLSDFISDRIEGSKGLVLQSKGSDDRLAAEVLYDDRLFLLSSVTVRDLNADGVDDWVFIGGDRASGFGVFVEWGGSVQPTQAGERYRLEGTARHVLAGDMDNDGDVDLVVLDPLLGGAHLLKSTLAEQATAVRTSAAVRPAQHRLGDSYPNPFNPSVLLPLELATDAAGVSLRVYDVLGRRVRQVWQGPLGAGSHRFVWDGRDEAGRAVAAGVYVYQVEVDGRVEAKKMTKLP